MVVLAFVSPQKSSDGSFVVIIAVIGVPLHSSSKGTLSHVSITDGSILTLSGLL